MGGGTSDPYVVITLGDQTFKTRTVRTPIVRFVLGIGHVATCKRVLSLSIRLIQ